MSDLSKDSADEVKTEIIKKEQTGEFDFLEIDIIEKANELWSEKKTILLFAACFSLFGLFHYVFTPEEYESTATLIQEVESSGSFDGGSAFLRTLTGMNFSGGSGNLSAAARGRAPLPVNLYPLIVNSTDFQKDLIYKEIEFSTLDTTITLYDYFTKHYQPPFRDRTYAFISEMTIYLPFTILNTIRRMPGKVRGIFSSGSSNTERIEVESVSDNIQEIEFDHRLLSVSNRESSVIQNMRLRIQITIGGGVTEILTILPDPKAAALINALLVERIQEYMTEYRVEKARQNFEDVQQQYENAQIRYEEAQLELAEYQDSNLNIRSNVFGTREEYLRDQRNLRYNVYNSLAQEVEQARIAMQQEIPVFNILEKPNIPNSPTAGSSDLVLVFSVVIGFFLGTGWVLIRNFFRNG